MDIKNVDLLSLLPPFMQQDETTQAMVKALQPLLRDLGGQSGNALIYPRLNELSGDIVDELAWERHVDFYDPSLPLDTKRDLVRRSDEIHRYKGTPYALEILARSVFGDARIEEWFEYGGEPYFFQVRSSNQRVTKDLSDSFRAMLDSVKNARSWLEAIIIMIHARLENEHRFTPTLSIRATLNPLNKRVTAYWNGKHKWDGSITWSSFDKNNPYTMPVGMKIAGFLSANQYWHGGWTLGTHHTNKNVQQPGLKLAFEHKTPHDLTATKSYHFSMRNAWSSKSQMIIHKQFTWNGEMKWDGHLLWSGNKAVYDL